MSSEYWKKKKQEKKKDLRVCQKCYDLFKDYDLFLFFRDGKIPHWSLCCYKCVTELPKDTITKPFSKKKKKLVIDTKNWVEGESTKKGNKRYIFINENGVEVTLLPETGIKKGLTPKQIKK